MKLSKRLTKSAYTINDNCALCGHHELLHKLSDGKCQVKILASGYSSFADLPTCGCPGFQALERKEGEDG